MSTQINIGQDSQQQGIDIDLEELLATRLLVQGNSGSGKSHLLRRLLEECAGLVQQVVIDPEGDFASLSEPFGHVVIDGAAYTAREIEALGARVRQHRASVVLALDELEVEQQIRCAALFLTALFDAPREHWYPALVVVDEAQMFAPSAAGEMSDETRRMTLSAMTNLMCRGRKRGLAGIVATQRLAKLAKNVAAEASNFLMGRTFLDIDMQRAADLLGMDRRQADRIRDLQRGQFLGLGPAVSRRPVAVNVGSVRTGGKNAATGLLPLPDATGEGMETLLTDKLDEAVAEPDMPRPMRTPRPAAELERALSTAVPAAVSRTVPLSRVSQPVERPANTDCAPEKVEAEPAGTSNGAPAAIPTNDDDGVFEIDDVVRELARSDGATFRSTTSLFRDFAILCRQRGVPSAHVDIGHFRRLFACEIGGLHKLEGAAYEVVAEMIEGVDEDVLAPYLAMVVATALGEPMPGEEDLALLYGSSSPSRVRRLLDHLERSGLIVIREEFGGERSIIVPQVAERINESEAA
ncbi:ATP-binding protein [Erythrobacter longus]|uniref:ATP-binding protein n=1 Tax=Erythrobacter longus TaxID=1044 RepID=A0A074M4Z2_ERYLO|nr:ATP-binding protein [Erythrobacter longus]KEO87710.1 ATP-binding protein [Erythrobacter longus]